MPRRREILVGAIAAAFGSRLAWAEASQPWAPEAALRKKILVDNPARLYGFSS